jgi:hypothetical protein
LSSSGFVVADERCVGVREAAEMNQDAYVSGITERKTGLYVPNVETTRLVRDERGRLRLTG